MKFRFLIPCAALAISAVACAAPAAPPSPTRAPAATTAPRTAPKQYASIPPMTIDPQKQYSAVLHTTEGDITVQLLAAEAPSTVNNFVFLARDHFYEAIKFHRVINGFMIQTGDPLGNGTGGPGYKFADEPVKLDYKPGIVAMANAGPNTNGSQFFIVHKDRTGTLPKNYTIFGQVSAGMEVVDKIATTPVKPGGEGSSPVKDILINSVDITEK